MTTRSIGEIIRPIFARAITQAAELHGVQVLLASCETDAERKACIMGWLEEGHLTGDQARLLIEAAMLEAA